METPRLLDVRTGRKKAIGGQVTAYGKASRHGPVRVTTRGLEGDEVGNPRVHGGPEKAVYCYAAANYPRWVADWPQHAAKLVPGGFAENLLWSAVDEAQLCVGDRWRAGTVLLEICQPRQPCATLARWFGDPRMVEAMVRNGRSGWYCRVVEEGVLAAGDPLILEDRPPGAWTVAAVLATSYKPPGAEALRALAAAPGLAAGWAASAARAAEARTPKPLWDPAAAIGPAGLEPATRPL